jgi:glycosyltransferase involved in cell wall biosynthesis
MNTVSVITICYNNLEELQSTCSSVDEQSTSPGEHWIIDGSTNEEILTWLTSSQQPSYRRWLHERDKGIADAFNKGIDLSSSPITHILNSGDRYFIPEAIAIAKKQFEDNADLKWLHGMYVQNRGGVDVISGARFEKDKLWKGMRTVAHPTMFIKKELYNIYGFYDLSYNVAMDFDFLVRIRNENFNFIPKPLVYFAPGGASNVQFSKGLAEVRKSYFTNIGKSYRLILWQLRQQALKIFMQSAAGKTWFNLKNRKRIIKSK